MAARPGSSRGRAGPMGGLAPSAAQLAMSTGASGMPSNGFAGFPGSTAGAPPGTAMGGMRAPSFGGARPPTSAAFHPPGTAAGLGVLRPGSALKRLPTAGGPAVLGPIGLATQVNVSARPVTQQGLGAPLKPQGPGRQVADRTYYAGEIRGKIHEITQETQSLRAEIAKKESDTALHGQLERRYEEVAKEVRGLEGDLADFNLALDKLRTHADPSDIQQLHNHMHQRNQQERARVDQLFLRRAAVDKQASAVEQELQAVHAEAAQRLAAMGEGVQAEYDELRVRALQASEELHAKEARALELEARIRHARMELGSDAFRTHEQGLELLRRRRELEQRRTALEAEVADAEQGVSSPEEMRERLLQRVKDLNASIKEGEQRIKQLEEELEAQQDIAQQRRAELTEAKKNASKSQKFEALYERDRKMQDFIDGFAKTKAAELDQKKQLQRTITLLLEHISKGVALQQALPDKQHLTELKDELSFKQQKAKNSEETLQHVKQSLEQRREELSKIATLDGKIAKEVTQLRQRMEQMQTESKTFQSADQLKQQSEQAKQALAAERAALKQRRDAFKQELQATEQETEQAQKELAQDRVAQILEEQQQRMRAAAETAFALSDFVETRKREGAYESLVKEVTDCVTRINTALVQTPLR